MLSRKDIGKRIYDVERDLADILHTINKYPKRLSHLDSVRLLSAMDRIKDIVKIRLEVLTKRIKESGPKSQERNESGVMGDHSEMEMLHLSEVLVESIEVLENRVSAADFLTRDVISREVKWPAILCKNTAKRAVGTVESPGYNVAVRVLGSIEYPNYEDNVFSKYAAHFERVIQSYFEEGCWQVWRGIPGLLEVDEINALGCLTDDDMLFMSRRLSSNGVSSKMSKRGREALHKVAFAIKYLAYMTISPCRMRAWLWQDWVNYRIFHWEKLGQSYKRGLEPVHEGKARYPEELPLRGNYDSGEEPRFEEECQHYFGGLGELLSVADAMIKSI